MRAKIDLAAIDRDQFVVKERDGRFLVNPAKSKHVWNDSELHLRSLLTDSDGRVLSAGLPKFFNYSERPDDDESFRRAFHRGAVQFTEKLDGTLIILSYVDGKPHFRTRGNFDLGDFHEPVMRLVEEKYPRLLTVHEGPSFFSAVTALESWLFEYTAPDNRIVLSYNEPSLRVLGYVGLDDLKPGWDTFALDHFSLVTGVPVVKLVDVHSLGHDLVDVLDGIRNWSGAEGVVVRYVKSDEQGIAVSPALIKIKARDYVRLHALKFRLEGKVKKLAFLLGVKTIQEGYEKLYEMGVDFEAAEFVAKELFAYVENFHVVSDRWRAYKQCLFPATLIKDDDPKARRKRFVEHARFQITEQGLPEAYFAAAMKWFDGKADDAWLALMASEVMGESVNTVKQWAKNPTLAVSDMLAVPVTDD